MRRLLLAIPVVAALGVLSCTSDDPTIEAPPAPDPRPPTPPEWDRAVTRPDEATAAADRAACKFGRGALPDETLGASIPMGKDIPIETIVVLMQENRSFDHYFGKFGKYAGRADFAGAPDDATNPDRTGPVSSGSHPWQQAAHHCFLDTNHGWVGTHTQINGGKMDGFYETNHDIKGEVMPDPTMALRDGERAMWWYDERQIPYYYALAKAFGIGDHYFCSVPGPTLPNRMYLFAATSFGQTSNVFPDIGAYPFPANDAVILDELDKRHVDWKLYTSGGPAGAAAVLSVQLPVRYNRDVTFPIEDFYRDAAEGKLPPVVYVDPNFLKTGDPDNDDEHPPSNLQIGQRFVSKVVDALMKSPQWGKLALFITYDEHGGLYDHMPPPKACVPDDKPLIDKQGNPLAGAFDSYGVRVPMIVVSPWAKRGHVSHDVYDHASILRFIQAKHRLPALTARDANALVPIDFFDFASPPNLSIPALPEAVVDPGEMTYCDQTFKRE
ncbi:MAG: alkaline phosphatase family protein [Labilithrix sp.]|nr:alkaline phosphatase family protein [Labilithrix sp.]